MKAHCHHSVCVVKCLFNANTMVNVNFKVENTWINLEELQYTHHYIIDVTKTTGLRFLGVVVASSPIDGEMGLSSYNEIGGV